MGILEERRKLRKKLERDARKKFEESRQTELEFLAERNGIDVKYLTEEHNNALWEDEIDTVRRVCEQKGNVETPEEVADRRSRRASWLDRQHDSRIAHRYLESGERIATCDHDHEIAQKIEHLKEVAKFEWFGRSHSNSWGKDPAKIMEAEERSIALMAAITRAIRLMRKKGKDIPDVLDYPDPNYTEFEILNSALRILKSLERDNQLPPL